MAPLVLKTRLAIRTHTSTHSQQHGTLSLFHATILLRKEKWDASGANEAVGRVSANIPESTKQYVGKVFKREHLRGPSVYFGFGEERPFYVEKNPSLLVERLRHNVTFFYLNYLLLTGVLFCLSTLLSPTTLVGVAVLAAVWMWMIRASVDGNVVIGCKLMLLYMDQLDCVCGGFVSAPEDCSWLTFSLPCLHLPFIKKQRFKSPKRLPCSSCQSLRLFSCSGSFKVYFGGPSSRLDFWWRCTPFCEMPPCTRIWTTSWLWRGTSEASWEEKMHPF